MAKRGGLPGGMPGNMNNLMKQAQRMQRQMEEQQAELENKEFSATAGGGVVEVTVTGKREVSKVKIDPEAVDPDDVEMLEDLIVAATNEALRKCEEESQAQMAKITGGLGGLGGGSGLGYMLGLHAPGKKLDAVSVLSVIHHLALAHGLAVTKMRAVAKQPVKTGFSSTGDLCYPSKECDEDIDAARAECFNIVKGNMTFNHTIFCDMTCLGRYPDIAGTELHLEPGLEKIGHYEELPFVKDGDIELIHQPIDYLGINVYNGHEINAAGHINKKPGSPRTALGWPVTPGVMNYGIRYLYERYNLPIYIFEDGLACNDIISLDGKVHDSNRIDFLTRYLTDLEKAYKAGVPILGYFHWSFTDNFEWHSGYDPRFGLIYVDYETQQRIPKDSAYWYSD